MLTEHFGIKGKDWDVIIIGDGSGTTSDKTCGYGSVLIRNHSFARIPFYGGMSHGTNIASEILAMLMPLSFLSNNKAGSKQGGCRVYLFSDCQHIVDGINNGDSPWASELKVNRELWLALHATRRRGLILKAYHLPREHNDLPHNLANIARRSQIKLLETLEDNHHQTAYTFFANEED